MCGVCASYAHHYAAPQPAPSIVDGMLRHMQPRGPDDCGVWRSHDDRLIIGHQRLAIIDPSVKGRQPMQLVSTPDNRFSNNDGLVISFNGEIYNYQQLRKDLVASGVRFRSRSDTEVILHLFRCYGIGMVSHLRGMFAIIIWDADAQRLYLIRDGYGIKPLYYSDDGWTTHVASGVRTLQTIPSISRSPDLAGVAGFFLFGAVPEPFTILEQVRAVPAGCYVCIDAMGVHDPVQWYDVSATIHAGATTQPRCANEQLKLTKTALTESVHAHLESDVPLGVFLSSGIDSAVVAAVASEKAPHTLTSLTLRFEEFIGTCSDEGPGARQIADQYNLQHHELVVSQTTLNQALDAHLETMDQPTLDGINTALVSQFAHSLSIKTCLSGVGGDELFGGYPSFRHMPRWRKQARMLSPIWGMGTSARMTAKMLGIDRLLSPKAISALEYGKSWEGSYLLCRGIFMPWELAQLMGRDRAREGLARLNNAEYLMQHTQRASPAFAQICALESSMYLRHQLLRDSDWASSKYAVEIRTPFCDTKLLSDIAPHQAVRAKYGKKILTDLLNTPLGNHLSSRNKTGFTLPMHSVLRSSTKLDEWRRQPSLVDNSCHWARRLAYSVGTRFNEQFV